ncbi:DnaD domain protein [Mycoplasmatota bacterium zrk1]
MNVKILEDIKIQSGGNLSSDDISVLTLLYQPLIGSNAYVLYMTLFNLLSREKLTKKCLLKNVLAVCNFTIVEFNESKDTLEAIGLLNSYYNNQKGYILDLNIPLTANEFILDGSLGIYLYSEVGEDDFKNLTKHFKISNSIPSDFENVTKTFDEVFTTSVSNIPLKGNYLSKEKNAFIKFTNDFDFDLFCNDFSKTFFNRKELSDKLKDTLVKLAFTYNLTEAEMQDVYLGSLNNKGILDYKTLPKEARKVYQYKFKQDAPKLSDKKTEIVGNDIKSHMKTMSPGQLLQELSGMPAAQADLEIVYKLMSVNKMSTELINVMIYYVLKVNNKKMPTYPYFEKIANEWGRVGIKSLEEAFDYLNKEKKTNKKSYTKKGSKKPEWYKEYKLEREEKDKIIKLDDEEKYKNVDYKKAYDTFKKL